MNKWFILILVLLLISFSIVIAVAKQDIRLTPNRSYEITLLVRSSDLAKSGILSKDKIKINVEKVWKAKAVPGENNLWRLTGKFTIPFSLGNIRMPEGMGTFAVNTVNIETIDRKKAN